MLCARVRARRCPLCLLFRVADTDVAAEISNMKDDMSTMKAGLQSIMETLAKMQQQQAGASTTTGSSTAAGNPPVPKAKKGRYVDRASGVAVPGGGGAEEPLPRDGARGFIPLEHLRDAVAGGLEEPREPGPLHRVRVRHVPSKQSLGGALGHVFFLAVRGLSLALDGARSRVRGFEFFEFALELRLDEE